MALNEYLGTIVMEVDGQEIEVMSVSPTQRTGRKLVKTMNKTGRAKGFSQGMEEFDLKVQAVIPKDTPRDWGAIKGAKITLYPVSTGGSRTSYLDCFTLQVGENYKVDDTAVVDIDMVALRKVIE